MMRAPAPLHIYGILRPMESMAPSRPPILQHRDLDPWWRRVIDLIVGVLFGEGRMGNG